MFNLAAQVGHKPAIENPWEDISINCLGHMKFLEACKSKILVVE